MCVLSRTFGLSRAARPKTHHLCAALAAIARGGAAVGDVVHGPIDPDMPADAKWPSPDTARRRLGWAPREHHAHFRACVRRAGVGASFTEEDLDRFVPRRLWGVVAQLIADGPAVSVVRAENALADLAEHPVKGNRRRSGGRGARTTMESRLAALNNLFAAISELRRGRHPSQYLEAWPESAPAVAKPLMADGGYDTEAPPIEDVRAAWSDLTADIRHRLRTGDSFSEELAAAVSLTPATARRAGVVRVARGRALLGIFVIVGGRLDAICRLRRQDLVRDHVGPPPDFRTGWALQLCPMKSLAEDEVRVKPLPPDLADAICVYLAVRDALYGEPPPSTPLFTAATKPLEPMPEVSLRAIFSGAVPKRLNFNPSERTLQPRHGGVALRDGTGVLVPRRSRLPEDFVDKWAERYAKQASAVSAVPLERPAVESLLSKHVGHTPHEYRHLAFQLGVRAGAIWNADREPPGPLAPPEPIAYAHALLDHGNAREMSRIYRGLNRKQAFELLSGRASEVMWELVTGTLGARKVPDIDAYVDVLHELRATEQDLEGLAEAARTLRAATDTPARLPQAPRNAFLSTKLDFVIAQNDMLLCQNQELRSLALQGHEQTFEAVRLSSRRAALVRRLDELRWEEGTWRRIPDGEPVPVINWDEIEARRLGHALLPAPAEQPQERDWLLVAEFCDVAGVDKGTASRWMNGRAPDSPHAPWLPGEVPVDECAGVRRLWVPGIRPEFFKTPLMRERLSELLATWPRQQGWTDESGRPTGKARKRLKLPEPFASEYARMHGLDQSESAVA